MNPPQQNKSHSSGLSANAAELEAANPVNTMTLSSNSQTAPTCICRDKHYYADCFIINDKHPKQPRGYKPSSEKLRKAALKKHTRYTAKSSTSSSSSPIQLDDRLPLLDNDSCIVSIGAKLSEPTYNSNNLIDSQLTANTSSNIYADDDVISTGTLTALPLVDPDWNTHVINTQAMHIKANLLKKLVNEMYKSAVYILNRIPTEALQWKMPYKILPTKEDIFVTRDVVFDTDQYFTRNEQYAHKSIIEEVIKLLKYLPNLENDDIEFEELFTCQQCYNYDLTSATPNTGLQMGGESSESIITFRSKLRDKELDLPEGYQTYEEIVPKDINLELDTSNIITDKSQYKRCDLDVFAVNFQTTNTGITHVPEYLHAFSNEISKLSHSL
ncbi:MAG: hypothetical protein M1839_007306 [Geoglossum umbratile]|nr:MAG: hypothetical protein M1839_007306 [Geoglossum umbratile]